MYNIPPVSGKDSFDCWCSGWGGGGLGGLRLLGLGKADPIAKCWLKRASIILEAMRKMRTKVMEEICHYLLC